MDYIWLALTVVSLGCNSLVNGLYARRIKRLNPYIYTMFTGIVAIVFFNL